MTGPGRRTRRRRPPRAVAALAARRFRAGALVLPVLVGLVSGVGTGAVLTPRTEPEAVVSSVLVRTDRSGSASRSGHPAPPSSAPSASSSTAAPDVVVPAPTTVAQPDPDAVDAAGLTVADRAAGLLSRAVPDRASGDLVVVPGSEPAPDPARPVTTVRVEVEAGLDVDGALFAQTVMTILNDARGWGADGSVSFARTDGEADVRVVLASPGTVDDLCAPLETVGLYSCGTNGHAVLNHLRWVDATTEFGDRTQYREYLVNHEVGHLLGHRHVECPADGAVAPVMQQQTVGVAPCVPNGWPFPEGA